MFIEEAINIETPIGRLRVIPNEDSDYPGFNIYFNGELVSSTEYNSDTNRIRTIAYTELNDEPAHIIDYNKGDE